MLYTIPLLSVLLGYAIALFLKPKNKKNIKLLLAFSGSFLLSLTVLHLLPDTYHVQEHMNSTAGPGHNNRIGIFIMLGILFQIILEYFSKGAEHGHVHTHHDKEIHKMPWLLFISLCTHALLEGFPVSHHHHLAWGIAIHHFPISIILTTFFINTHINNKVIFSFMMVFALMTPLGTILSEYLPILNRYYTEISAIVIGILFHISSTIIFESSEDHQFNIAKLSVIALGITCAYFV